jgi:hypothetical protein
LNAKVGDGVTTTARRPIEVGTSLHEVPTMKLRFWH